jgi:hypothetical protein
MRNFIKFYYLLLLITPCAAAAQNTSPKTPDKRLADIFELNKARPQVLLLGVFHFAGEQVDANTTPLNLRVNMLSAERQQQIEQLVQQLARFKPTKIAIEGPPGRQKYYDSLYRDYCAGKPLTGKFPLPADETLQLSFRLARLLKLDRVYPVNAQPFAFKLSPADSLLTYEKYKDQADPSFTYWDSHYDAEKAYQDSLAFYLPLNKYLQYLNSPVKQAKTVGRWLITTKRGTNTEPVGADGFITRYFNRNVRIYSNVQRIVTNPADRILVVYGATHMYMLKQLFAASPEFELKDIMEYLK